MRFDPASAIRRIVLTHWHNDHTRGAGVLVRTAPDAAVICSAALRTTELKTAFAASRFPHVAPSGIDELRSVFEQLHARPAAGRGSFFEGLRWVVADTRVFASSRCGVWALSPSSGMLSRTFVNLDALIPVEGEPRRRAVPHLPNDSAVVLWIEFGGIAALLGADLERSSDPRRGWQAIVGSTERPSGRAQVYKVSHHGAESGDDPSIWQDLLEPDPYAVLTPYTGGRPLPTQKDIDRLRRFTPHLYATGRNRGAKPKDLNPMVARVLRQKATDVRQLETPMGQIRLRAEPAQARCSVELFGGAYQA
jgi:hypothetical protein